jgi:hypothetical protein
MAFIGFFDVGSFKEGIVGAVGSNPAVPTSIFLKKTSSDVFFYFRRCN